MLAEWGKQQKIQSRKDHIFIILPINSLNIFDISEKICGLDKEQLSRVVKIEHSELEKFKSNISEKSKIFNEYLKQLGLKDLVNYKTPHIRNSHGFLIEEISGNKIAYPGDCPLN